MTPLPFYITVHRRLILSALPTFDPTQVNGFHPQLTAVSNPVLPNDIPPPSWPSYVPTVTSRRVEERRNDSRRGPSGSTTSPPATNDEASAAPITSEIDARMTIVVRRLQNDAKDTDRTRSKMLRKRVRREERNERRHLRKRLRQQQGGHQGRRTSETTEMSVSSMSSSFSTSTGTDATTTTTTTSCASSVATTSYGTTEATHVGSSSSTARATPPAMAPSTTTLPMSEGYGDKVYASSAQPISSRVEAVPIPSVDDETHFSEVYSDVFMASNRPQFLATLGGRLVACEFS